MHPLNLLVRFLLEIVLLVTLGYWGWYRGGGGGLGIVFALTVPFLAAFFWGTFAVPHDPSRSGEAPVPVPGIIRLLLELALFGFGVWALADAGLGGWGGLFGGLTFVHYVLSFRRIKWLLNQPGK